MKTGMRAGTDGSVKGFTLLELLITMVIIAILTAIAIPNYQQYVQKARRTEATTALYRVAGALEKYFLSTNEYTADISKLSGHGLHASGSSWLTEGAFYSVIVSDDGTTPPQVVATAIGPQAADTECTSFTYALTGTRTATGSGTDPTAECWD